MRIQNKRSCKGKETPMIILRLRQNENKDSLLPFGGSAITERLE